MRNTFWRKLENPVGLANIQITDYYNIGYMITRIFVPPEHRGNRYASMMLLELTQEADTHGQNLWLEIVPTGGLDWRQLEDWYLRNDFRRHSSGLLVRRPRIIKGV